MLSESQRAVLAARLRRDRAANPGGDRAANPAGRITRRPAGTVNPPATFGQEQLWFLDRFAPGRSTYNVPCPVRIRGQLDAEALSQAMDGLLARHEALRTRLVSGERSRPVQLVGPPPRDIVEMLDYSGAGPDEAWPRLIRLAADELRRPFDLAAGPLLRAYLVRLAADDHVLLVTVHHAVFDGFSAGVLLQDLAALYAAAVTGEPSGLAELPVQFADYALWERQRLQGSMLAELETYWRDALDGFELLRLPTDRPRPSVDTFDGSQETRSLPVELLQGLHELSHREGTTLFVTLMAAFQALLHRYTGQTDLVAGTSTANRSRAVLEPLIGFLVNTLPIRCDLSGDPAFTELLGRVRDATVGAYAHQDLPFGKIVETLRVEREASRPPVMQVTFSLAGVPDLEVPAAGVTFGLAGKLSDADTAKFDLDLLAEARSDGLWLEATYTSALFDAATIRRLLGNFEVLLRGAVADPSARLSRLPVLTARELHQELAEWNDTAAVFPVTCVHQGFEAQAARTPDGVAAEFEGERVSYAQLNRQANQVARRLRAAGVGPEVLVGVCMHASLRRLAALLGIWKAGGGYVPLDPALPAERMSFMMADAGMAVMLADDATLGRLTEPQAALLSLDAEWAAVSELDDSDLADSAITPANVAYVIYTSGSTGRPKGVVVEHRQVSNFLRGQIRRWHVDAQDAVLASHSLSFDPSVQDLFMPLLCGARVVLASAQTLQSPPRLAALIRDRRVTIVLLTPPVLSLLGDRQFPDLRWLSSGGEGLPSELACRWLRPGLRFTNEYGPTEATVTALCMELDAGTQLPPPIGLPLPNYQAYVLDEQLNPVPAGVIGELHIGGASVARGYLNRPELTKERFIPDPFRPGSGARLYKTGDLVRRRADGTIVFLGRTDDQAKIRGLRIEPGEIETALAAHPAVAQAVVTVLTDPAGEKQLAGYLRAEPDTEPSPSELRAHLARILPSYMIPAYLTTVAAFPLNTSGKIDRSALPAPGHAPPAAGYVAPATFLETVLTGLYAAVLNVEQVGATDSFFDIGGSSLQVMRLVDMISKELGVDVGVTTIFLHPAPRQLAASIDAIRSGLRRADGSGPLVELANGVGELPLFLIHAVGGTIFSYAQLASELAGVFKVYGMEAPGLGQDGATADSLAGLVSDYTQRIRAVQPAGPYRLAGWSMGGVIAFEVARRLEQAGQRVASLVLLDAPFATPDTDTPPQAQLAGRFLADATHSLGLDTASLPDPATSNAAEQLAWLTECLTAGSTSTSTAGTGSSGGTGGSGGSTETGAVAAQLQRRFDVFQAHIQILAGYQPTAPVVRAPTLIIGADDSPNAPALALWPRVLGGPVATQPVPGDHYNFLRPPLVTEVGTSILKWHAGSA